MWWTSHPVRFLWTEVGIWVMHQSVIGVSACISVLWVALEARSGRCGHLADFARRSETLLAGFVLQCGLHRWHSTKIDNFASPACLGQLWALLLTHRKVMCRSRWVFPASAGPVLDYILPFLLTNSLFKFGHSKVKGVGLVHFDIFADGWIQDKFILNLLRAIGLGTRW